MPLGPEEPGTTEAELGLAEAVPRFFFDTQDGETVCDEQGVELSDVQEARREAVRLLTHIIRDRLDEFLRTQALSVIVRNADRLTYFAIHVSAVNSPAVNSGRESKAG